MFNLNADSIWNWLENDQKITENFPEEDGKGTQITPNRQSVQEFPILLPILAHSTGIW